MISSRLQADLSPNAVTRAIAARLAARRSLIDLTESNPTRVGIAYPSICWRRSPTRRRSPTIRSPSA